MAIITEIRRKLPLLPKNNEKTKDTNDTPGAVIHNICIDDIVPNRSQPRSAFNQNAILRLSDSIKRYGILQPLTVRKVMLPIVSNTHGSNAAAKHPVIYELVAGERRLRAAKLAQLTTVPCIIINTDDATSAELAIIENLLRENLNMFEQAEAFQRLINEFHLTQEEAARRVSMSQSAVANKLRILRLLPEEREKILEAGLTERHARALLKLNDPALRGDVLQQILERKMNVSATETYIDHIVCEMSRYEYRNKTEKSGQAVEDSAVLSSPSTAFWPDSDEMSTASADDTLPPAIRSVISQRKARFKGSIKDMQLFYNSIRNAMHILETAGIAGQMRKNEAEDQVVLTITLSKNEQNAKT